jgi:predicted NBD/HSP70 family sugar kinase
VEYVLEKATRQHTRDHNTRLVLRKIYDAGEISRATLARLTGLTRTTISEVVADLIEQGLVQEVGQRPAGVGRTPTMLSVVDDARLIVAVDITHHEIQGALMNLRGAIQRQARLPLSGQDGGTALTLLFPLLDSLIKAAGSPLLGIGISSPGLIDAASGTVQRAVNFDWHSLPLRAMVQERHNLPVYIANDGHMVALAEYMFGQKQSASPLVTIKVGRGIGAGIMLNGQLLSSEAFGAGEIGHIVVERNGPRCNCGKLGCLEAIANASAIVERAQALAQHNPTSLLRQFAPDVAAIGIDTISQACQAGDYAARQLIVDVGRYLGIAVANLIAVLGARRVVVTGRIAPFGPVLREAIESEIRQLILPDLAELAEIEVLAQGPDTVLLGAAALLLTNELGLARLVRRQAEDEAIAA